MGQAHGLPLQPVKRSPIMTAPPVVSDNDQPQSGELYGHIVYHPSMHATGVVVRPHMAALQTLVFFGSQIHELLETLVAGMPHGKAFTLAARALPVAREMCGARLPVYERTSACVYYVDGFAVMRLDANNVISLVAGSNTEEGRADGRGAAARFGGIRAMAADGQGRIFLTQGDDIRVLDVRTSEVNTTPWSEPTAGEWVDLRYDVAAGWLVAATRTAVCIAAIRNCNVAGQGRRSLILATPQLLAGSWTESDRRDGIGATARFRDISAVLLAIAGTCYVMDSCTVRRVDAAQQIVETEAEEAPSFQGMTFLPGGAGMACTVLGQTYVLSGIPFDATAMEALAGVVYPPMTTPSLSTSTGSSTGSSTTSSGQSSPRPSNSRIPVAAEPKLVDLLVAPPGQDTSDAVTATVTVLVTPGSGRGRAFVAHRSVLVESSDYFAQLLGPDSVGGFADSGAARVTLHDADPRVFGCLLAYMYSGELALPDDLLRPAAELAGRLLMREGCTGSLQDRLLRAVAPSSAISELVWAERHSMTQLVAQLKTYLLRHRKEVAAAGARAQGELSSLAALNPELAAEIMMLFLNV